MSSMHSHIHANARTKQGLNSRAACTITPKWNAVDCIICASLTTTCKMPAVQKVYLHFLLLRPCFTESLSITKLHLRLLHQPFLYHNLISLFYLLHSMCLLYMFMDVFICSCHFFSVLQNITSFSKARREGEKKQFMSSNTMK